MNQFSASAGPVYTLQSIGSTPFPVGHDIAITWFLVKNHASKTGTKRFRKHPVVQDLVTGVRHVPFSLAAGDSLASGHYTDGSDEPGSPKWIVNGKRISRLDDYPVGEITYARVLECSLFPAWDWTYTVIDYEVTSVERLI